MCEAGRGSNRSGGERGQASVELLGVLPVLVALALLAAQALSAGWALWSTAAAARAGARAHLVGRDAVATSLRALPSSLEGEARIEGDSVTVSALAPAPIQDLPEIPVRTTASLGVGGAR